MNIFRNKRKGKLKNVGKRLFLVAFAFIMTTFAWFTYVKTLDIDFDLHINAWNVKYYLGIGDNKTEITVRPANIAFDKLYPAMEDQIKKITVENNGEVYLELDYQFSDLYILGKQYEIVKSKSEATTDYYSIIGEKENDVYDIYSNQLLITDKDSVLENDVPDDLEDDEENNESGEEDENDYDIPFSLEIKCPHTVKNNESDIITIRLVWNGEDDINDTKWGHMIAEYIALSENSEALISFNLNINATQIIEENDIVGERSLAEISQKNYGDYIDLETNLLDKSIQLSDGTTPSTDWRVFYSDDDYVYAILADYLPVVSIPSDIELATSGNYGVSATNSEDLMKILDTSEYSGEYNKWKQISSCLLDTVGSVDKTIWENSLKTNLNEYAYTSINGGSRIASTQLFSLNLVDSNFRLADSNTDKLKNDSLYFPHSSAQSGCSGFWLATEGEDGKIYAVNSDGTVTQEEYSKTTYGIRPMIKLDKDLTMAKNEETVGTKVKKVWKIKNLPKHEEVYVGTAEVHSKCKYCQKTFANHRMLDDGYCKCGYSTVGPVLAQMKPENYGDYIDLGTNLTLTGQALSDGTMPLTDWRIFYRDENYVYAITSDYLKTYGVSSVQTILTNAGLVGGDSSHLYQVNHSSNRTGLINGLNNETAWKSLISTTLQNKGAKVKGAIDLEKWVASWNSHENKTEYPMLYTAQTSSNMDDGLKGYYIGNSEKPTSYSYSNSGTTGYNNTLYYPRKTVVNSCSYYWLNSPSADTNDNSIMAVGVNGFVNSNAYNSNASGVRPVVSLPLGIKLTKEEKNGKNEWHLIEEPEKEERDITEPKINYANSNIVNVGSKANVTVQFNATDEHIDKENSLLNMEDLTVMVGTNIVYEKGVPADGLLASNFTLEEDKDTLEKGIKYTLKMNELVFEGTKNIEIIVPKGKIKDTSNNINLVNSISTSAGNHVTPNGTLDSLVTLANYGDYINLKTKINLTDVVLSDGILPLEDWRIFYKDSNYVYAILSDYLPYSYESTLETGLENYSSSYPYNWKSNTNRTDLLEKLEGTSNSNAWDKLIPKDLKKLGAEVKGAIDLEKWVASWNAKGNNMLYTAHDSTGYYVGDEENPTNYSFDAGSLVGYNNSLFFPHKVEISNNAGYWIDSLSANSADDVILISNSGEISKNEFNYRKSGVRPVVSIPLTIEANSEIRDNQIVWNVLADKTKPEIEYESSELESHNSKLTATVKFKATDENIDKENSSINLNDLKILLNSNPIWNTGTPLGGLQTSDFTLAEDKTSLENGIKYTLTVNNLEFTGSKALSITIPSGKIKDISKNENSAKTMTMELENEIIPSINPDIALGQTVSYSPRGTYTCLAQYSGYSSDQSMSSASGQSFQVTDWKVLNIDSTTGKVDLIASSPTSGSVYLQGANGYNNAVKLLNDACSALYSNSSKGITARSINMEDIEAKMDMESSVVTSAKGSSYGTTKGPYSSENSWYPNIYAQEKNSLINGGARKTDGLDLSKQTEWVTGKTKGTSISPMNTYYYLSASNFTTALGANSSIIPNGSGMYYWVASRCNKTYNGAYADTSNCDFSVRCLNSGDLDDKRLFFSYDSAYDFSEPVLPVVSLSSQLLEKNTDGDTDWIVDLSEPAPAPAMVSFTGFNVSNENGVNYVQGINEGTTVSDLISNTNGGDVEIYKGDEVVNVDQNLATGMEVKVNTDSGIETYEVVVTGDINGDASVGDSDLLMMARFMVGCERESEMVQGPYLKATDMDFDEENATDKDLLRLARNLIE